MALADDSHRSDRKRPSRDRPNRHGVRLVEATPSALPLKGARPRRAASDARSVRERQENRLFEFQDRSPRRDDLPVFLSPAAVHRSVVAPCPIIVPQGGMAETRIVAHFQQMPEELGAPDGDVEPTSGRPERINWDGNHFRDRRFRRNDSRPFHFGPQMRIGS